MKKLLIILAASMGVAFAQSQNPCFMQIFQGSGANFNSGNFNNSNPQCNGWVVMFTAQGFSAFSAQLESAPDNAGVPGSFSAFAGTVVSGLNPFTGVNTGFQGFVTYSGYFPWLRLRLVSTTGTGTITINAYGFPPANPATGGGTCPNPCPVIGTAAAGAPPSGAPVQTGVTDGTNMRTVRGDTNGRAEQAFISTALADGLSNTEQTASGNGVIDISPFFPYAFNGTTWDRSFVSINQAQVTLSAATDVVMVSATASKTTRVSKFDMSWDNTADVTIRQGTTSSTPCDTSQVAIAGPYKGLTALFEDYTAVSALRTTVAARDICVHFSVSVTGGGQAFWSVF